MFKNYILSVLLLSMFVGCSSSTEDSPPVTTNSDETNSSKTDNSSNGDKPAQDLDSNNTNGVDTSIDSGDIKNREIVMEKNKVYKVSTGDTLVETNDAKVKIYKNSDTDYFQVKLLSGEAKIIKGSD